jgi:hypothetical protein
MKQVFGVSYPLRAGMKLIGLIPAAARDRVNRALRDQGVSFDLNQVKRENLDELVRSDGRRGSCRREESQGESPGFLRVGLPQVTRARRDPA